VFRSIGRDVTLFIHDLEFELKYQTYLCDVNFFYLYIEYNLDIYIQNHKILFQITYEYFIFMNLLLIDFFYYL